MMAGDLPRVFGMDGKVAIVTGGASGIGLSVAFVLGRAGASICIVDHDAKGAETARQMLVEEGITAISTPADVSREDQVVDALSATIARFGKIDSLVTSAGIAIREDSVKLPLAAWEKVIAVNMTGTFLCARHGARYMMESGGGSIVLIASIMGLSGGGIYPNVSYQATKGAVVNMARAFAVEWAPNNIRVNAVAPTWVNTPLTAGLFASEEITQKICDLTPLRRLAESEDVAHAVLYLSSEAASMVTGHILAVDGGFLAQ